MKGVVDRDQLESIRDLFDTELRDGGEQLASIRFVLRAWRESILYLVSKSRDKPFIK